MRIIDLKDTGREFLLTHGCGLCLGHFDGVHLGHRALVDALILENKKRPSPLPLGALCFSTPPRDYFSAVPTPQLTPLALKLEKLRQAGLRFAAVFDFPEIKDLDAFDFVKDVLIQQLDCRLLVCGYNHTFGKNAAGTPADLAKYFGTQPGRVFFTVPEVTVNGEAVSSTRIRRSLLEGRPEEAAPLLGAAYSLTGTVQNGKHLGQNMDIPTANLFFENGQLVPRHGVYITTAKVGRRIYTGISNVGVRPTFADGDRVNCETFLFHFHGDLYGKQVTVSFLRYLRGETKFEGIPQLKAQIEKDICQAKAYFGLS